MSDLLIDLKGSNGHWRQDRAKENYIKEMKLQEENARRNKLREARKRHAEIIEAARQQKLQDEERRRNLELAERERRQQEEQLALLRAKREQEEHNKACNEQLKQLKQPRPCGVCKGTGKCITCGGKGYFAATYISRVVNKESKHRQFHGRTRRGCYDCGGVKKDENEGNVTVPLTMATDCNNPITGTGLCSTCDGTGKTRLSHADIGGADAGWLRDIQALMRLMIASELGVCLTDKIWVVQLVAAEVLQEQGKSGGHAHKLAILLRNKHWKVRAAAAESLGSGGASAAPYLTDLRGLLQDPHQEVRKAAVQSLGIVAVGLPTNQQTIAVSELTQLQYDRNEDIAEIAKYSLQKIKEAQEDR